MKGNIKLFDVVALTVDLPEHKLKRGYVGTIVESLSNGLPLKWSSVIVMGIHMLHLG